MNRREFCQAALVPLLALGAAQDQDEEGLEKLKGVSITRVSGFRHEAPRPHLEGKNAVKDVHGGFTADDVLRIETNAGVEGIGAGSATPVEARELLGKRLAEFWKPGVGVVSPLRRADHALYDLIGKALDLPTSTILGGMGPDWIPVYDGSVYFNDLLPAHEGRVGVPRLLHEVEQSLKAGYRAFKIKVGRGHRWMEPEVGFQRDVEVVKAVRKLVGKGVTLMADANNGFDLETAERWLDAVGNELFFVEEMFPEQVERDLLFKEFLRRKGYAALVADGESADDLDDFETLIAREAIDVYQPDIRRWGLTRICALARKLSVKPRLRLAPHNWGSFLGLYMQLVVAKAVPNFLIAEADPSTSDLFDTSAYVFANGKMRLPNVPGCGLTLRDDVFRAKYAKDAWVVS